MATAGLAELEQAAGILLGPPNLVTPEQRSQAERLFLQFSKTPFYHLTVCGAYKFHYG